MFREIKTQITSKGNLPFKVLPNTPFAEIKLSVNTCCEHLYDLNSWEAAAPYKLDGAKPSTFITQLTDALVNYFSLKSKKGHQKKISATQEKHVCVL